MHHFFFAVSSVCLGPMWGLFARRVVWLPSWKDLAIFSVHFFVAAKIREVADVKDLSTFSAVSRAFGTKRVR